MNEYVGDRLLDFAYYLSHRLNMELDLQNLFGLHVHVHSCTRWLRPRNYPLSTAFGLIIDIQRLPPTPFSLVLRKEYFDYPLRDSFAVLYIYKG